MSASAILKLQAAGFSTEQVTALAELIDTQAATKADLDAAEHKLGSKMEAIERRVDAVEHRLDSKIDAFQRQLDSKIDGVEHRLELRIGKLEGDGVLAKWMLGFVLAFQVAIFAKLFLH